MPLAECSNRGNQFHWSWEDAFDKFGFGDGDGQVMTSVVVAALEDAGYAPNANEWGLHNTVIMSITHNGVEQMPNEADIGYDNPRDYLPAEIIALLDEAFPNEEVAR